MVHAGNYQWGIKKAKQRRTNNGKRPGKNILHGYRNPVTNTAANRANKAVGQQHSGGQGNKGNNDQVQIIGHQSSELQFKPTEKNTGQ